MISNIYRTWFLKWRFWFSKWDRYGSYPSDSFSLRHISWPNETKRVCSKEAAASTTISSEQSQCWAKTTVFVNSNGGTTGHRASVQSLTNCKKKNISEVCTQGKFGYSFTAEALKFKPRPYIRTLIRLFSHTEVTNINFSN